MKKLPQSAFPARLREIPSPPPELFVRGNVALLNENADTYTDKFSDGPKFLCVVGSRGASQYGVDACRSIIRDLTGPDIVIVSGLAIGIDSIAHEAALAAKLPTIAVLASGLDDNSIYPRQNLGLAKEIMAAGGCLISEFGEHYHPHKYNFPQRNRIMAGLSHATLIIEASEKSGTLITSRLALDYNRDVLAVPGSIFSEKSGGPNRLIAEGATPITSGQDILHILGLDSDIHSEDKNVSAILSDLTEIERKIYEILSEPLSRAEILKKISGDTSEITAAISMLEMKNIITESGGLLRRVH